MSYQIFIKGNNTFTVQVTQETLTKRFILFCLWIKTKRIFNKFRINYSYSS